MNIIKFEINIEDIIPQQHYLSEDKLITSRESLKEYKSPGLIYVIKYKDKVYSIDGHHRLYHLWKDGIKVVEVTNEEADNDSKLYRYLADEADQLGLVSIGDLESRILSHDQFQILWIDKCQKLLKAL